MIQTVHLEKGCDSFTVCVAIGMFVLGVWGITPLSFFFWNRSILPELVAFLQMKSFSFVRINTIVLFSITDENALRFGPSRPIAKCVKKCVNRDKQELEQKQNKNNNSSNRK